MPTTPSQPRKSDSARVEPTEGEPVTLPELLVSGSRSLNADIQRDIDDPQPYAIFDRTTIELSGAINLNDLLLKMVSSNTYTTSHSQSVAFLCDLRDLQLRGSRIWHVNGNRCEGLVDRGGSWCI